ncbi:MAG: DUF1203 domain-containing protein [Pseudomonadota bacterium]|nr:DUF1203 domain-containing protein [Pseudomonadota bacterium]
MDFRVLPLDVAPLQHLFGLSDQALAAFGAEAMVVDQSPGFPCRIGLRDPEVGARMILLNFEHQPGATPYRSSHAIFIEDGAAPAEPVVNMVDAYLSPRLLSVRAFDATHHMRDADVCEGNDAAELFRRLLDHPQVSYLHVHTARRGCYLARVEAV